MEMSEYLNDSCAKKKKRTRKCAKDKNFGYFGSDSLSYICCDALGKAQLYCGAESSGP